MSNHEKRASSHLDYLDGWRGIAILLVLIGHFGGDKYIWTDLSKFGVEFFFVLSGRLMAEILFVRKVNLTRFFIRRFSRIYPALLFFVCVVTIIAWNTEYRHGLAAAVLALTFTINYAMILTHHVALLDHLWSLCVEEHSYVLLAMIAMLVRKLDWSTSNILLSVGILAITSGLIGHYVFHLDFFDNAWRSDVASAGLFLAGGAWLKFRKTPIAPWLPFVALFMAIAFRITDNYVLRFGVSTILLAISVATIGLSNTAARSIIFESKGLRLLGTWSFSLYIWQQPFYKISVDGELPSLVYMLPATACALVSFYLIERPTRNAINSYFDKHFRKRLNEHHA